MQEKKHFFYFFSLKDLQIIRFIRPIRTAYRIGVRIFAGILLGCFLKITLI